MATRDVFVVDAAIRSRPVDRCHVDRSMLKEEPGEGRSQPSFLSLCSTPTKTVITYMYVQTLPHKLYSYPTPCTPPMKLSLCMLFPSLAAGFAVHGSLSSFVTSPSSCISSPSLMMVTPPEEQSEAAGAPADEETTDASPVNSKDSSSGPEQEQVLAGQGQAQEQEQAQAPPRATKSNTFVQAGAAPTFSATAPAGMPPEINEATPSGGGYRAFQKYRTLDQEMNARAAQSGFARSQGVKASMSATDVSNNPASGYYKYATLNQMENTKAAQSGFAQAQGVKASMSATDVSNNPASGYYKYATLNQMENAKAAQSGFAATRARATFSATDVTNNAGGGDFFKYRTLNQEDNERALNASYRQVTYSATQATDSASGSSNIPIVEKKGDEDVPEVEEEKVPGE